MFIRSDGLLVKRTRTGRDLRRVAEMMSDLRGHGIPVPRVYEAIKQNLDDPPVEDVFSYLSQVLPGGQRHNTGSPR